jgi:hypothetical protein
LDFDLDPAQSPQGFRRAQSPQREPALEGCGAVGAERGNQAGFCLARDRIARKEKQALRAPGILKGTRGSGFSGIHAKEPVQLLPHPAVHAKQCSPVRTA